MGQILADAPLKGGVEEGPPAVDVVDPAIIPDVPIKPQKIKYLLIGLLAGLTLGIGLAFFQEYLDDTIKDAEQAKRVLGLPLLAIIPHFPSRDGNDQLHVAMISLAEPKSQVAEAFRSLRTSIHFSAINREIRSVKSPLR